MVDLKGSPFYLSEQQIKWVEHTKEKLTLEQKIGQLFCIMGGDYTAEKLDEIVTEGKAGAILLRPAPAKEIKEIYERLDKLTNIPLLKAANLEEGGSGGISDGTLFGWPMQVAAANDDSVTEKFAKVCAVEGESVGINWTFSPVCDLDLNYQNPITNVRTYGSQLDRVKRNTQIYTKTLQNAGMAACAKHFPGDGVDYRDQHLHPTYNTLPAEEWYRTYGAIYKELIANDLLSVMVGHIVQPYVAMDVNPSLSIADCLPASMSKELLTEVLRKRLEFNGVITSDATIMGGYCMAMERKDALYTSIMAGCDMLVFNTDFEEDYSYMLDAAKSGKLTQERLEEAVTRILALKAKVVAMPKSQEEIQGDLWAKECADKAVTLVKNLQPDILPLTKEKYEKIRLIILGKDEIGDGSITEITQSILQEYGYPVTVYDPEQDELHGTSSLDKKCITIYMANYEQASNQTTVRIDWCKKHALDAPRFLNEVDCIFVSLGNPYLLQDVPRVKTYMNAYTASKHTIWAVIDKIMGKSTFEGISPVDPYCGLIDTRL